MSLMNQHLLPVLGNVDASRRSLSAGGRGSPCSTCRILCLHSPLPGKNPEPAAPGPQVPRGISPARASSGVHSRWGPSCHRRGTEHALCGVWVHLGAGARGFLFLFRKASVHRSVQDQVNATWETRQAPASHCALRKNTAALSSKPVS